MSICDPRDVYGYFQYTSDNTNYNGTLMNTGGSWTNGSGYITYPSYTVYPGYNDWAVPVQPLNPPIPAEPFVLSPEAIEALKKEFEKMYVGSGIPEIKVPRKGRMIRPYDEE